MYIANKKKLSVILLLTVFISLSLVAFKPFKHAPQNEFKNLKVLPKDISKDSLDTIMHNFTHSLGVKCNFCHVHTGDNMRQGWDFASDDKPEKETARYMLKMTAGINTTYFNFKNSARPDTIRVVNCVTCHRGIPHPEADDIADQMKLLGNDHNMLPPGNRPPADSNHMAPPPPPGHDN